MQMASGLEHTTDAESRRMPGEVASRTSYLTMRLSRSFSQDLSRALAQVGSSLEEYEILALLDESSQDTQLSITAALGIDRSQVVGLASSLEDEGFIHRSRNPLDRRRYLVRLTGEGRRRLASLRDVIDAVEREILASLSPDDQASLKSLLLNLSQEGTTRGAEPRGTIW